MRTLQCARYSKAASSMVSPIDFTPERLLSEVGALEHNTQCTHNERSLQVLTRTENGKLASDVGSCSALNLPASTAGGAGAGAGESVAFSTSDSTFGVETAPGSCVCAATGSAAGDVTGVCLSIGCDSGLGACFLLSCTSKRCILSKSSRTHARSPRGCRKFSLCSAYPRPCLAVLGFATSALYTCSFPELGLGPK